jgi:uncharacterized protein
MQYNVSQLLKAHSGVSRRYEVEADIEGLDEELKPRDLLRGEVQLMRTSQGILVTGHLHTVVELTCDRCLEPFTVPVEIDLEEEFRPTVDIGTGASLPVVAEEDGAGLINGHHILDLTEVVRQALLLAIPMHPLCRPDCAGLCPECGQNLNEGSCQCQPRVEDLRWAALKELRIP